MFDTVSQGCLPTRPHSIGIYLVPGFSMLTLSSVLEAFREANRLSGRHLYDWQLFSGAGGETPASAGMTFTTCALPVGESGLDLLLVCAGFDPLSEGEATYAPLRYLAAHGCALGGISTGADVLAAAGLLDGYRATRHWEDAVVAQENHPLVHWTGNLFEIDRDRLTCSGGNATFDMMLNLIRRDHGDQLASRVSNQFQHERIRAEEDEQHPYEEQRLAAKNGRVIEAIKLMESNVDSPLPLAEITGTLGISRRQLERMFTQFTGQSPANYYRDLRLKRARALLIHTDLPVVEVATATGFISQSHMAKSYRSRFGKSPRQERYARV